MAAADFYVPELPQAAPEVADAYKMHSGLLPTSDTKQHMLFFWLIQAKVNQPRDKLVIWLNGGPGCSSMDGMLLENGPFKITDKGKVKVNPDSWVHNANMLYVDQPAGTGFSIANGVFAHTQTEAATEFLGFLENFFFAFPEYKKAEASNVAMYFAGESYAGQYIPYVGHEILKRNRNTVAQAHHMDLRGLIIGNGWIDPLRQYRAYIDYSEAHGLLQIPKYKKAADLAWDACKAAMEKSDTIKDNRCERIVDAVQGESKEGGKMCLNMYDIRLRDKTPSDGCGMGWPPGLEATTTYLQRADVRTALHVTHAGTWTECYNPVFSAMTDDPSPPAYKLLPDILSEIEVTLFSGDMDFICNWMGTKEMIAELTWGGKKGFEDAPQMSWLVEDQLKGYYQTARNLSFVLVHNASHMVPIDEPLASLDLFNRAIRATSTIKSVVIDPSAIVQPGEDLQPNKPEQSEKPPVEGTPVTGGRHYYAGAVLLILMLVGLLGCGAYRMRGKMDLSAIREIVNRIRGGRSMPVRRNASNWHEVQGDEEALFVAEDLEEGVDMGNLRYPPR
ncbi:hypothetical protein PhCBS80983_g03094 [Powellomyces hirtus]|uniref:Pheromone-processing carboxypeptidase KEX1 n=1 Tax=Powellomyces hirtus TaxID=109895 RepID=A0A507E3X9_9FUNG|nr:hypothetical protein PhCBS80983_g03094 [Powellomyces hirtus]